MNTCYKCGRELPFGGVECDPPCAREVGSDFTQEQIDAQMKEYEAMSVPIDWEKVRTLNDLKEVVRAFLFDDRVMRDSLAYEQLKRFLKE